MQALAHQGSVGNAGPWGVWGGRQECKGDTRVHLCQRARALLHVAQRSSATRAVPQSPPGGPSCAGTDFVMTTGAGVIAPAEEKEAHSASNSRDVT